MLAFLHQNIRKRISQKFESYPHPEKLKNIVDKVVYATALIIPIVTIPQAYQIFILKNSTGVSAFSWICYALANIVWTIYGIIHDEKPIIISNVANFVINVIVVIETFIY